MQECAYPKQFSNQTMQCEEFEKVECGKRKDTKDGCKLDLQYHYFSPSCDYSHDKFTISLYTFVKSCK